MVSAKNSVASSWTGTQQVMGPIVVIPYSIEKQEEVWNERKKETTFKTKTVYKQRYLFPDKLNVEAAIENDVRYKGIYKIPVYTSLLNVSGQLSKDSLTETIKSIQDKGDNVTIGKAYVTTTVSDPRGINRIPTLTWNNEKLSFNPGSKIKSYNNGIHAFIPSIETTDQAVNFTYQLEIRGMETISFVPVGEEASVKVSSDWPHPEFVGMFLPASRTIDGSGYQAEWNVTSFASNIAAKVKRCERGNCNDLMATSFGVKHIETVDVYLQSERSVKYGLLFIGLSFVAFFVFEILKKLPIHAIQYTLVGFAIATFYLLLVSLSEHIEFALAYGIASVCCVGLLLFYLRYVLRGFKHALAFAGILLLLYGVLYVIISAEDFALLMGASLTFLILGMVMVSTRNIDWYEVGERIQIKPLRASKSEDEQVS
jgi:inner membrane protein